MPSSITGCQMQDSVGGCYRLLDSSHWQVTATIATIAPVDVCRKPWAAHGFARSAFIAQEGLRRRVGVHFSRQAQGSECIQTSHAQNLPQGHASAHCAAVAARDRCSRDATCQTAVAAHMPGTDSCTHRVHGGLTAVLLVVCCKVLGQLRKAHIANLRLEPVGQQHTRRLQRPVLHLQAPSTCCCAVDHPQ